MSHLRKMLLDEAAEDTDDGRRAKKALEAYDAKEDDPEEHKEPDGDEPEPESEDDEEARKKAESNDEAKRKAAWSRKMTRADDVEEAKAESEEEDAKRAEDDARKAEADAEEEDAMALRATNSATIKDHVLRAADYRARAAKAREIRNRCLKDAMILRACAKTNALSRSAIAKNQALEARIGKKLPSSLPTNPAVSALGAKGTTGKGQANKSNALSLAALDPKFKATARLGKSAGSGCVQMDMSGIGMDPDVDLAEAQRMLAEMEGTG